MKHSTRAFLSLLCAESSTTFAFLASSANHRVAGLPLSMKSGDEITFASFLKEDSDGMQRRQALNVLMGGGAMLLLDPVSGAALASQDPPNLQEYSDFQMSDEGWSFR